MAGLSTVVIAGCGSLQADSAEAEERRCGVYARVLGS